MTLSATKNFFTQGWRIFEPDPAIESWRKSSLASCRQAVTNPANRQWLRHDGTWFAGVNALENNERGEVNGGPPISGQAVQFVSRQLDIQPIRWDKAQISVCYPGYPKVSDDEPETAFRYRLKRDAAHIDGLLRIGPEKRRFLREYHGFILGIPMVDFSHDASPLVVWNGSHEIARKTFRSVLDVYTPDGWEEIDLTEIYHALRRRIFEQCKRVEIAVKPGQVFVIHRLALHGMAPWGKNASAGSDGRMICYFRPEFADPVKWLQAP